MSKPAAVLGYIKTFRQQRGELVVSIGFPIADANAVHNALGGYPSDDESRWVAVALIDESAAKAHMLSKQQPEAPKVEDDASRAIRQAGALAGKESFWKWVNQNYDTLIIGQEDTECWIRNMCRISSRAEFRTNAEALARWRQIHRDYQRWANEPDDGEG